VKLVKTKCFKLRQRSENYSKMFLLSTAMTKRNIFAFYLHIDDQMK